MVQLILEAAPPGGTDVFLVGAAFAALDRASAQSRAAALLQPKIPFCHVRILNEKRYNNSLGIISQFLPAGIPKYWEIFPNQDDIVKQ